MVVWFCCDGWSSDGWSSSIGLQLHFFILYFHINTLSMSHCCELKLKLSYLVLESYNQSSLKFRQISLGLTLHYFQWQVICHTKICLIWLLPEPFRSLRHSFSPSEGKTQSRRWWKEKMPAIREWMRKFFLCSPYPLRQPFITKSFPLV